MNKAILKSSVDLEHERELFEEAYSNQYPNVIHAHPNKLKRNEHGEYIDGAVFVAWDMWQIGRRSAPPQSAAMHDALEAIASNGLDARQCMETAQRALDEVQKIGLVKGEVASEKGAQSATGVFAWLNREKVIELAFDAGLGHSAQHPSHYPAYARYAELVAGAALVHQAEAIAPAVSMIRQLAAAAEVFLKGGVAPLSPLISKAQAFVAGHDLVEVQELDDGVAFEVEIQSGRLVWDHKAGARAIAYAGFVAGRASAVSANAASASGDAAKVAVDAARWRAVESGSSELTLRLHYSRPDQRVAVIDAARTSADKSA